VSNSVIDYAAVVTFLMTVIPAVYKLLQPLVLIKIDSEKNRQLQQALKIADNLAASAVNEMSTMATMTPSERRDEAIKFVSNQLNQMDFQLAVDLISAKVEKAYQEMKSLK